MTRVLVTGASGFVGSAFVRSLAQTHTVRAAARHPNAIPDIAGVERVALADLAQADDFAPLVAQCDVVIHLAGVAHAGPGIPDATYDRINRAATARLARAAATAGAARFVFISSVRAQSGPACAHILDETITPQPTDAYGRSKLAAERELAASGMNYTILRPPLIYGPGVKGNLAALMRLAATPLPLPFASLTNRRSLLALDNLIAAIRHVMATPATERQTYLVADAVPISLPQMIAAMRRAQGRSPNLVPVPAALIKAALVAAGRDDLWQRLGGELIIDASRLTATGWRAVIATPDGLTAMVQAALPRKSGTAERSTA